MDGIEQKSALDLKRWFLIASVVIVSLMVIGGGIFVYQKALSGRKTASITPTPTVGPPPTPETTEIPQEASPAPSLARVDLKIKILNGTGVPGTAGKAAKYLEKLGYQGIKTGNADSFDYEETVIKIKEDKKDYLSLLKEDVSKEYTLAEETETLAEKESFDVIIILGK